MSEVLPNMDELLKRAEKKGREDAIEKYNGKLTHNFMKMIGTHTIGEILDKTYEQMKSNK